MQSVTCGTAPVPTSNLSKICDIRWIPSGTEVEFIARVHAVAQLKPPPNPVMILTMRDEGRSMQVRILHKDPVWEEAQRCTRESLVRIRGTKSGDACGALVNDVSKLAVLALAVKDLPRGFEELHGALGNAETPTGGCELPALEQRLDNRVLDVRVAATAAIFKLLSGVLELSVEYCIANGFQWTPTPALVNYNIPGDKDYFPVAYCGGQPAWLAQTNELHMQMVMSMDIKKQFEIRTNFRAEQNISKRRLTEFTAIEAVMAHEHWTELLDTTEGLFVFIIRGLYERQKYREAIEAAKNLYPSAAGGTFMLGFGDDGRLPRLTFREARLLLQEHHAGGTSVGLEEDLSADEEALLGVLMRSKHGTDAFIITDFPAVLRPYSWQPSSSSHSGTNSFDFIARGEEVASCAQCIHDPTKLRAAISQRTDIDAPMWKPYLAAFDAGMPPHGMFGFGANRLVKTFLGLDDVHEAVLFPRDAGRLAP